jgi:hypothetical protein
MNLSEQRCLHHPTREAVARCPGCQQTFCRECVTEHDDRVLCADCLRRQSAGEKEPRVRLLAVARLGQFLCGLLVSWLFFYWLGQALLALPSSFHEGTVWTQPALEHP